MKKIFIAAILFISGLATVLFIIDKATNLYIVTKTSLLDTDYPSNVLFYISKPLGMDVLFYFGISLLIVGLGILIFECFKKQ